MADFEFLENPVSKKWVISAPRRAKRPDVAKGTEPVCPFCPGKEKDEPELYRVPSPENSENSDNQTFRHSDNQTIRNSEYSESSENDSNWLVRVIPNKFPFAPIHEIIIHSPDHHKNFGELSQDHTQLILQTYKQRYNSHKDKGQVYIFHNRGEAAGESLPHPHTQLAVVPSGVKMDISRLDAMYPVIASEQRERGNLEIASSSTTPRNDVIITKFFTIFSPQTAQWPDEVWVAPKQRGRAFGEITDEEIIDLSDVLTRLVQLFNIRHKNEFPFNFYIYPGGDWYLRIIPRLKSLGGFEIGTGVFINTQDPKDTMSFIKAHFENTSQVIESDPEHYYRHV